MYGILVDVTRCTACEKCVAACTTSHGLDRHLAEHDRAATADGLSANRLSTVLSVGNGRFARKSCMHCLEPACVSACLVGGLTKDPAGAVRYDPDKCIGCRYCMLACPFSVPRYEWDKTTPLMVKCDMCIEKLHDGQQPACVAACPQQVLTFDKRDTLIALARKRISANQNRYIDHIWGEQELGGTSVMYIADTDLAALGWPEYTAASIPSLTEPLVHKTPFIGLSVAVGLLGLNWIVKRRNQLAEEQSDRRTAYRAEDDNHE